MRGEASTWNGNCLMGDHGTELSLWRSMRCNRWCRLRRLHCRRSGCHRWSSYGLRQTKLEVIDMDYKKMSGASFIAGGLVILLGTTSNIGNWSAIAGWSIGIILFVLAGIFALKAHDAPKKLNAPQNAPPARYPRRATQHSPAGMDTLRPHSMRRRRRGLFRRHPKPPAGRPGSARLAIAPRAKRPGTCHRSATDRQ